MPTSPPTPRSQKQLWPAIGMGCAIVVVCGVARWRAVLRGLGQVVGCGESAATVAAPSASTRAAAAATAAVGSGTGCGEKEAGVVDGRMRRMTLADLELVLGWAREEGWNPGRDDAAAFLAADPGGFFVWEQRPSDACGDVAGSRARCDGPVAAISVVNHDARHAFLGLYICRPEFRGRGIGLALWTAALQHAGEGIAGGRSTGAAAAAAAAANEEEPRERAITLEGVAAQQPNYQRSGFQTVGHTVRMAGPPLQQQGGGSSSTLASRARTTDIARATGAGSGRKGSGGGGGGDGSGGSGSGARLRVRPAAQRDLAALVALDARATGYPRRAFATAWFTDTEHRRTVLLEVLEGGSGGAVDDGGGRSGGGDGDDGGGDDGGCVDAGGGDGAGGSGAPCGGRAAPATDVLAFATFRRCAEGVKVGPLHAPSRAQALALLRACPLAGAGAGDGDRLYVDVPASDDEGGGGGGGGGACGGSGGDGGRRENALLGLLRDELEFVPVFEAARMVRGVAAAAHPPAYFASATLEVG